MDAACQSPCHARAPGALPPVGELSNRNRGAEGGAFHQHWLCPGWEWGGLVWGSRVGAELKKAPRIGARRLRAAKRGSAISALDAVLLDVFPGILFVLEPRCHPPTA